ncbi:hypothetical protein [Streptomyces sp. PTD5-9]|uniref:hypothetical protein n=1 Tax=Streptomyces sp. PTD5-9 TaxID=3120150 RepID=UPI00300B1CA7
MSGEITVAEAAELVADIWRKAAVDGAMSEQTVEKFIQLTDRFIRYAKAQDTLALADVDAGLTGAFITARGRSRRGKVAVAAISTMRLRRSVLRTFFRTARQLLLTDADPTLDIALPGRPERRIRPLDALEAELCRHFAQLTEGATRHAAVLALALSGVHSAEVARVLPEHVDLAGCRVFAAGSARIASRWCDLDRWSVQCLRRRIEGLPTPVVPLIGTGGGTPPQQQARICVALRDVLVRAGLADDLSLRPASITAYAGRAAFEASGRVEDAARVLGMGSLDRTAELVGYDWRRPAAAA